MSSHRTRAALALCAALASAPAARADANLLLNGSFEAPAGCPVNCVMLGGSAAIEGWTTLLSGVEYLDPQDFGVGAAPDGRMAVDLANYTYPQGGGVAQTFDTVAGQAYTLSFWTGNAQFDGRTGTGTVHVQVAGVDIVIDTPLADSRLGVWERRQIGFLADSARTELRLSNTQDPLLHYALIDAVSVTAVPEAPTRWLALSGLALLLARRRL